jgi:uncharacterized protein
MPSEFDSIQLITSSLADEYDANPALYDSNPSFVSEARNQRMVGDNVLILGASKGLGLEIAKLTYDLGAHNIKAARSYTDGERERKTFLHCDLASLESTRSFQERLRASGLQIDRFFWVAGMGLKKPFEDCTDQEVLDVFNVNLVHASLVAKQVWRQMRQVGGKSFTVISSTSGLRFRPNEVAYCGSKMGQSGVGGSLGKENQDPNIKVSVFYPGGMQTEFYGDDEPADFESYLDPVKVAKEVVTDVVNQTEPYYERVIERGSL